MSLETVVPEGLAVLDADSHFTDLEDLWTSRAPAPYKDQILHVEEVEGERQWVIEGTPVGKAGGGSTIDREGVKHPFLESMIEWDFERAHVAAWDVDARLAVLDDMGIRHQVLYPNALGLGGQTLGEVKDPVLRRLCVEIFNDSRAEIQERTNNRLLPMPILPAWDVEESVREAERIGGLGLRGINMTSDPQDLGAPDLANTAWDPLWEVCQDLQLPVHFHIGASLTAMNFYGQYYWESQDEYVKPAIGGSMLFIGNARVVINTIFSGLFDRFPKLKMVSVESGIGWMPFILETMDWELPENAPVQAAQLARPPSAYFRSNWYGTTWFESGHGRFQDLVDIVGEDNILFETDFPHPTALWPKPLEHAREAMATLRPESRRKILGENGTKLYRLD
jgi:predicted TIM-barrel fold metal-dependent hydrolase